MISAELCHYTTKFNSERHKSTKIFSIHSSKILFFPYSLYYWAFQDPPCRHRCSKGSTSPLSIQSNFVKTSFHFAVCPCTCPYRRCKITSNPPNRPIWFVDAQLWFADAAFFISKHPTSVKKHLHFHTFLPKSLHNPNKCLIFAPSVLAKPLNNAQIVRGVFYLWHI